MSKKRRWAKKRAYYIDALGGVCKHCNSTDKLQFDHIDRESKLFDISGWHFDKQKQHIEDEVKKCQLLCPPCHARKSATERGWNTYPEEHGVHSMYTNKKCRCTKCKYANTQYMIEFYKKRRFLKKYKLTIGKLILSM